MSKSSTMTVRMLGGVAIVVAFFFATLFLFDYLGYDPSGKGDKWQKRFLNGSPIVVHFICGTQSTFDCFDTYTISYKGSGTSRCEHVQRNGEGPDLTGWCNGRPEDHTFSIRGALFAYNRTGEVTQGGKVVGSLSEQ
jgi:hypothetical protein